MHPTLERWRDSSFTLMTLSYFAGQVRNRLGRGHLSGATHSRMTPEGGAEYVLRVVRDYLRAAGWSASDLRGKRILEVGPGDNLGVALLMASAGAERVVCLDRFQTARSESRNNEVYRLLAEKAKGEFGDPGKLIDSRGELATSIIEWSRDVPIEDAARRFGPGSFDLIVSRAVLEHVFDLERAWQNMDTLLSPGGLMLHKVDFRNHGLFVPLGPLGFLTVPEPLWTWISSPDPTLNRQRASAYEALATRTGYEWSLPVTHLSTRDEEFDPPVDVLKEGLHFGRSDVDHVEGIRPRLAMPFKRMTTQDLLINGVFMRARKKAADGRPASV
jgi:SAM-dependent methyltransferase